MKPPSAEEIANQALIEELVQKMLAPVFHEPSDAVAVAALELARRLIHGVHMAEGMTVVQSFDELIRVIELMKASEETGLVIAETENPS